MINKRFHGLELRGFAGQSKSPSFEGTFGRMYRTLPPAKFDPEDLRKLARAMEAEAEGEPTPETENDDEENQGIDAGYTYLGQFIDHDLTFDPASSLQKQNDPDALVDFRTPRFDLDSLYGRGPDDQPYLYEADGLHMLLGRTLTGNEHDSKTRDLPRNTPTPGSPARALVGDPRNDENIIISQLHGVMIRFHNKIVDFLSKSGKTPSFEEVQMQVRWHYQWMILHDFLPTIVGKQQLADMFPNLNSGKSSKIKKDINFFHWRNDPFIPIEFTAAVYRFGHSMIRPIYRLNTSLPTRQQLFSANPEDSLVGFRGDFPSIWAIDWNLFFTPHNPSPQQGKNRVQKAYKIDTSLVNPLANLPAFIAVNPPSLPERNLLRGMTMSLPSGQRIARYMDEDVIPDDKLRVGKTTKDDFATNKKLTDISSKFKNNAPLWYYILAEGMQQFDGNDSTPIHLGPVGGRIVAEIFIGIMLGDSYSYLAQDAKWQPIAAFQNKGEFKMIDLINVATAL